MFPIAETKILKIILQFKFSIVTCRWRIMFWADLPRAAWDSQKMEWLYKFSKISWKTRLSLQTICTSMDMGCSYGLYNETKVKYSLKGSKLTGKFSLQLCKVYAWMTLL